MTGKKVAIGITGTGSLIGQAVIKCIKNSGIKEKVDLVGFDYIPGSVGSYWCSVNYLLPDIFKKNIEEKVWLNRLIELIHKHELRILFIGIDFELPVFAKHKAYIEQESGCNVVVSSSEIIAIADDKYLTAEFLKKNGLYYPKSYTKQEYKTGTLSFPLIVKPRVGFRSVGFNFVKDQKQFEEVLGKVESPVIQECIGSMEDEYTCGVIYFENKLHASIALKRTLREGNTSTAVYSSNTPRVIYEYLEQTANALKPYGVLNFQLRLDKDKKPKIFEINARHSGTTFMRALFGYNEIEYIVCFLMHWPLPKMENLKEGKVVRFFDEFLVEE